MVNLPASVAARAIKRYASETSNVLDEGLRLRLDWKHNLSYGSRPELIKDPVLVRHLGKLAEKCAAVLNIVFASIDVVEVEGRQLVLEVNAGVMMENFVELVPDGFARAKKIEAVCR